MGAGEPMRVGELVAIDGFDVVVAWAGESVSDGRCCRLFLEEGVTSLRSMSSRALFLLFSMLGCSNVPSGRLKIFDYECWMVGRTLMFESLSSNWWGTITGKSWRDWLADYFSGPSRSCAISAGLLIGLDGNED